MPSPVGKTEAGSAIHRRIMILKILPHDSRGTGVTVKQIQELLADRYDIRADERTIQRDLQSLLPPAYPIACDHSKPYFSHPTESRRADRRNSLSGSVRGEAPSRTVFG